MVVSRRACTERELRDKLAGRDFPPEAVEFALRRAVELRLVDDAHYARSFVDGRVRKAHGPSRIRRDLHQRGIDRALIDEVLAERAADPEAELIAYRTLLEKRFA